MIKRKKFQPEESRLNLIPIMDAVFIFIFFLLFSAQFIKMFEIETDAPIVREAPQDLKEDKDSLNLKVKITKRNYELYGGNAEELLGRFLRGPEKSKKKLKEKLLSLRKKYPKEDYAVIVPGKLTSYKEIVDTIDLVQSLPKGTGSFTVDLEGKKVKKEKIYTQVVLEPLE